MILLEALFISPRKSLDFPVYGTVRQTCDSALVYHVQDNTAAQPNSLRFNPRNSFQKFRSLSLLKSKLYF